MKNLLIIIGVIFLFSFNKDNIEEKTLTEIEASEIPMTTYEIKKLIKRVDSLEKKLNESIKWTDKNFYEIEYVYKRRSKYYDHKLKHVNMREDYFKH